MSTLFELKGKTIILTGGLGLIGKSFTEILVNQGAKVHVIDVLPMTYVTSQTNIIYHKADITQKSQLEKIKDKILNNDGKIDVLINNAALNPKVEQENMVASASQRFEDLSLEQWNREIEVNLTGTMLCCQVFGSTMKSGSSIINIASIYGLVAPDQSIYPKGFFKPITYGVTKAGVVNLTKYLASYWGEQNIRVNCLVLGGVENNQDSNFIEKYQQKTPLRRMATVTDYQGAVVFYASDASAYSTGAITVIDGGWTAL